MDALTSAERIALALAGQPVDRLPFCPFLAYVWEYFPSAVQQRGMLAFHHEVGADPLWRGAPCPVSQSTPGVEWRSRAEGELTIAECDTPVGSLRQVTRSSPTGNTTFLIEHPLKTEEDFKAQLWLEEHAEVRYTPQAMTEHLQGSGQEGFSLGMLIPRCKSAFQHMIEHLVGTEELNYALDDFPETVEALWAAMVANHLHAVRLAADSPYTYFITWEDSSTQNYSPAQYDRFIDAEIRQWCAILADHDKRYVQHACGHVRELVTRMADAGVAAVESISPPPTGNIALRDARAKVGARLGIIGGIEPTQFLNLSLDALGPYVEQVIADGAGGPFVLANSDSCPPGVTVEKFKRVAEVARAVTG